MTKVRFAVIVVRRDEMSDEKLEDFPLFADLRMLLSGSYYMTKITVTGNLTVCNSYHMINNIISDNDSVNYS